METIVVNTEKRAEVGGTNSTNVRKSGRIPAILYGGGMSENISVILNEVKSLIYTPDFKIAEIDVDGAKHKGIVKEVQFHPVTDEIMHIDFLRLIKGTDVKVEIPIRFRGESPGVKDGGILVQTMRKVQVKTKPEYLVHEVFCDISELKLGFAVRVRDIELDEHFEVMSNEATPIGNVEVPRALKSQEAEDELEEAIAADAAPEGEAPAED